ncbi:MAG: tRNA (guanine(10)-N(2))-dimethyltransferase [Candidatus Micrarchaeia archaeon]
MNDIYEEGLAKITHSNAFLNPKAKLLRDVSVGICQVLPIKDAKVLDATAATGIRGIRYYLEAKAKNVTFLDISKGAYNDIKSNMKINNVEGKIFNGSFQLFANSTKEKFDIIDIDPFGSSAPYIFDSLKIVHNGSYLFVTSTDTAVLCGAKPKACRRIYDSIPMHNHLCHEAGIRILIGYIARIAAQFNFGITPIYSIVYDTYMRVFLRVDYGSKEVERTLNNMGFAYYCENCGFTGLEKTEFPQDKCKICGRKLKVSGKMWGGSLYDKNISSSVARILENNDKYEFKIVKKIFEELDLPFYYYLPIITKKLKKSSVKISALGEKLNKLGYQFSETHMHRQSIKTNAPVSVIEDIINQI